MSTTLRALAHQGLRDLNCLRPAQVASPDIEAEFLVAANQMLDADLIDELMVYAYPASIFTLTALLEQYRIGTGQVSPNFAAARPTDIQDANIILNTISPAIRVPVDMMIADEWANIRVRAATPAATAPIYGIPTSLYYDKDFDATAGYATINLWPAPQATYQLEIFTSVTMPFTSFANVTTSYSFPPAYEKMMRKRLAVEMAPSLMMNNKLARMEGMLPVSLAMLEKVEKQALEATEAVRSFNAPDSVLTCDPAFMGGRKRGGWNYALGMYGRR